MAGDATANVAGLSNEELAAIAQRKYMGAENAPRPTPQVEVAIDRLDENVARLANAIERLEQKLIPVMSEDVSPTPDVGDPRQPGMAPVAVRLHGHATNVGNAHDRLTTLLERLEV